MELKQEVEYLRKKLALAEKARDAYQVALIKCKDELKAAQAKRKRKKARAQQERK